MSDLKPACKSEEMDETNFKQLQKVIICTCKSISVESHKPHEFEFTEETKIKIDVKSDNEQETKTLEPSTPLAMTTKRQTKTEPLDGSRLYKSENTEVKFHTLDCTCNCFSKKQPENESLSFDLPDRQLQVEHDHFPEPINAGWDPHENGRESPDSPEVASLPRSVPIPTRRRRILMDAVVVPTLKEVWGLNHRRPPAPEVIDVDSESVEEAQVKLEKLKNPKVKVQEGLTFNDDTVRARLRKIGLDIYPIPLPKATVDVFVTREFMSATYGGNPQETFPKIRTEMLDKHGLDDFMYPNLSYNPHAPQVPGANGLFFAATGQPAKDWPQVQRVISRIASATWQYVGQYKMHPDLPLTKEEWNSQSSIVRNTWATQVCSRGWGDYLRAKVYLRKETGPGNEPKIRDIENVLENGRFKTITPEDVADAFARGDEEILVYTMQCVGYDVNFQLNLADKMPNWVAPQRKPKKRPKKASGEQQDSNNGVKARGKKRKREPEDSPEKPRRKRKDPGKVAKGSG